MRGPPTLVNGIPLLQYMAMGFFDGAALLLERLIMDVNGVQIGKWIRFGGEFGQVDEISRGVAKVTVSSNVRKLAQKLPRTKIQTPCANTLFDSKCTLNPASFTHATTVNAGSTVNKLVTGLLEADGFYDPRPRCLHFRREHRRHQVGAQLCGRSHLLQLAAAVLAIERRHAERDRGMRQAAGHLHNQIFPTW
jgi:hypothetical protein